MLDVGHDIRIGVLEAGRFEQAALTLERGADALLIYETTRAGLSKGYKWGEMSWILETNDMMNRGIELMGAEVYKTYRIYQKPL